MVDEHLSDEQQAEKVKRWVQENGGFVLGGLVLGLGALFGWNQWQTYVEERGREASALYEEMQSVIAADKPDQAAELAMQLADEYSGVPYVDLARLSLARWYMDNNDPDKAADYLRQVMEKGGGDEVRHIARLRLARALIHQDRIADALEVLSYPAEDTAFGPRYHDVRGDAYYAMELYEDAAEQYRLALADQRPGLVDRALVQAKLDDLAPAAPAAGEAAVPADAG